MSSVRFEAVTKTFDDVTAVDSLDLLIPDGEFCVLLGPSGCGKTTALRMIAGLDTVTSGTLSIDDQIINDMPARQRDIAMVFQSYALYPHMTVRKNIESPLTARGKIDATERDQRVRDAAEMLDLTPYLDRKPGALSGGQRQRVALARAIVRRPGVFLMDEPLSNLDAKLRTQTRLELVDLWRRLGTTFVYVTHDQVEAMTMATMVAVMSTGRLQQVGAPQDVYDRPANLFVAGFIGSPPMNTITGTVAAGHIVTDAGAVPLEPNATLSTSIRPLVSQPVIGDHVIAGIRPEHLTVGGSDLTATVIAVELLGHERHVICRVADGRWTARQEADAAPIAPGDSIGLGVDADRVHVFDPESGERHN